jgi:multiple sugar transport system substrate-binding protein
MDRTGARSWSRRRVMNALAAGGTAAGVGAAFAACSSGETGGTAPKSSGPVALETWHTIGPGPTFDAFKALLDDYAAAHPGTTFPLTQLEGSSLQSAGYQGKITAAVASGTPPDVLHMNRPPEFGEAGMLAQLNDFIKKDKSFNQADFFEGPWARCEFFGRVWGVPVICDDRGLWFNKALFKEAGLDPNKPPRTWNDLEQAAVQLTRKSAGGYDRIGYIPLYGNVELYSYIYMNGGDVVKYTGSDKAEVVFNKPDAVEAAEAVVKLYDRVGGDDDDVAFQKTFQGGAQSPFFTGQLAMMRHGSWITGDLKRYGVQMDYGLAPEPYGPSAKGPATLNGGYNWSLSQGTRHAQQGWDFLSWFTQPAQAARFAVPQGNMPARKSALNQDYVQKNPDVKFFFEALKYAKPFPTAPWTQVMFDAVNGDAQTAIVQRKSSAKQALDEAAKIVQAEIDEYFAQKKR